MTDTTPRATGTIPLACAPNAIPADERAGHFALLAHLFTTAVRERRKLSDGYAYRFDVHALVDIARWIANERRCCRFLTFAIEIGADAAPLWLRVTGPAGTHAFLDVELPQPA